MKLEISNNHPIFALAPQVEKHSGDFLKCHGLNYFQYLRCYSDGSITCFHNTSDLLKTALECDFGVQSSFEAGHEKLPSYVFFWDEELPERPVNLVRERLGMHHGMTVVKRHRDYYDMIAFAMAEPRRNASAYYVNHLKIFEAFSENFIRTRTDLVSVHEREKLQGPKEFQDPNCSKICLPNHSIRFEVQGKNGPTYMTAQEVFCLQYLSQGRSYKEISRDLSISVRTIETYLERLKIRTGFQSREQLFDALSLCP